MFNNKMWCPTCKTIYPKSNFEIIAKNGPYEEPRRWRCGVCGTIFNL